VDLPAPKYMERNSRRQTPILSRGGGRRRLRFRKEAVCPSPFIDGEKATFLRLSTKLRCTPPCPSRGGQGASSLKPMGGDMGDVPPSPDTWVEGLQGGLGGRESEPSRPQGGDRRLSVSALKTKGSTTLKQRRIAGIQRASECYTGEREGCTSFPKLQ